MISIKVMFERERKREPDLSDFLCFTRAINGKKLNERVIIKNFRELVSENDWDMNSTEEIMDWIKKVNQGY